MLLILESVLVLALAYGSSPIPAIGPAESPKPSAAGLSSQGAEPLAVRELAPGVRLEIVELKEVSGDLLHLGFVVDNGTDEEVDPRSWGIIVGYSPGTACGLHLLDLPNLKRYPPGNCSSGSTLSVAPHGRHEFWAQYMAPPADVTTLTIQIPDAPPLYDVPISR